MDESGKKVFNIKQNAIEKSVSARAVNEVLNILLPNYTASRAEADELREVILEAVASSSTTGLEDDTREEFVSHCAEALKTALRGSLGKQSGKDEFVTYFENMLRDELKMH